MKGYEPQSEIERDLAQLLGGQRLAVLATHNAGQPYCSLVAFTMVNGLDEIVFATTRATRKYANLSQDQRVALMVDNRSGREEDFHEAMAATAVGIAEEIKDEARDRYVKLYLAAHPHMTDFVRSPSCAILRVRVETYYVVQRFQNVMELHMRP